MLPTMNHVLQILLDHIFKKIIKIHQWCQCQAQKLTVNFNHWIWKKIIILLKRYTVITLFWISGSRERIEMFREGNSFSPRVRHSESWNHQTEWNFMILENSFSQKIKDSSDIVFCFQDQSKWKYKFIKNLLTLTR